MSQPSLDTALQNINLKLKVRSINRKLNFQLSFLSQHFTMSVFLFNLYAPAHCYFRMISQNIRKLNTRSSQIKEPQILLKSHV